MKRYVVATLALLFCVSMLPRSAVAAPITKFSDLILVEGPWVDVRGYGTITLGAGVSDEQKLANTAAIQSAINNASSGSEVRLPPGVVYTKGTININKSRIYIRGASEAKYATTIMSDSGVVFNFAKTGTILDQVGISWVSFIGATTAQKIAIRSSDTSEFDMHHITTLYWTGGGSIALQYRGRQQLEVDKCDLSADRPIVIEMNPNTHGAMDNSLLDIDHAHFSDLLLMSTSTTGGNVHIDPGVNLSNVIFDGYQAWVGAKYGLYWVDNATIGNSTNLSLKNVRVENSTDDTGWLVYISHNNAMNGLIIENMTGSAATISGEPLNGIYLKRVFRAQINNSIVFSRTGKTALYVDNTCSMLSVKNFGVYSAATVTLDGGQRFIRLLRSPAFEGWTEALIDRGTDDTSSFSAWMNNGVKSWKGSGTLDNGASQGIQSVRFMETPLACVDGVAMVSVIYIQPDNTSVHGASTFGCFGKATRTPNCVQMSTTDNTVVFGDVAGKVNLIRGGGTSEWEVRNQTGATIKFYIHMN